MIIHYPAPNSQLKPPSEETCKVARKACYADDNYFNETSRGCVRCSDYHDCKDEVNRKAYRGWGSTTTVRRTLSGTQQISKTQSGALKPTGPSVVRSIARESSYNFDRPVMPQLARYMGFSVAEVCLEELLTLVNQSRTNYVEEVNSPITIDVTEDGSANIKVDKKG